MVSLIIVNPLHRGEDAAFTEDEMLAAIRKVVSTEDPGVVLGVGDDAALLDPPRGSAVATTDMLIEGVHFDLSLSSPRDVGYKAVVVNVSDVAAMAGRPKHALVALGLPPDASASWVMELYGGMLEAAAEYGLSMVGGDLSASERVVVSATVVGEVASGKAVTRSGAAPGERLVVTGALGAAAGGLVLSRAHPHDEVVSEWGRALLQAQFRPRARVDEAETLAQSGATAMMDISDGLALDLTRLCRESDVGARLELSRVPVARELSELAARHEVDPDELAISGGEDYELLATLDPAAVEPTARRLQERFGVSLTDVGEVTTEHAVVSVSLDGETAPLQAKGWDHFGR